MIRPRSRSRASRARQALLPSRLRRPLLGLCAGVALLVPAVAQAPERPSPEERLERAKLLESTGQDFARAAAIYESLVAAEAVPGALRTTAWFRLALCLQAMKQDTAASAALQKAAGGEGPDAAQAKRLLAGQDVADAHALAQSIQRAIRDYLEKESHPSNDLRWIGQAAVPELVAMTESFRYDRENMRLLVQMICTLAGERARSFFESVLRSDDVLYRRSVANGIHTGSKELHETLLRFTEDRDAEVRALAIRRLGSLMERNELAKRYQGSRSEPERSACLDEIAQQLLSLPLEEQREEYERLAGPAFARWPEASPDEREGLAAWFQSPLSNLAFSTPTGRRGLLLALGSPQRDDYLYPHLRHLTLGTLGAAGLPWQEFQEPLSSLGPVPTDGASRLRSTGQPDPWVLMWWIAATEQGHWGPESMSVLLEMLELGYEKYGPSGSNITNWIQKLARPEDLPRIAALVPQSGRQTLLLEWIGEQDAVANAVPALIRLAKDPPEDWHPDTTRMLTEALIASKQPEALRTVLELALSGKVDPEYPLRTLLQSWNGADANPAIAQLVMQEKVHAPTRSMALRRLLDADAQQYAELIPTCYRLGINTISERIQGQSFDRVALTNLWKSESDQDGLRVLQIDPQRLQELLPACLAAVRAAPEGNGSSASFRTDVLATLNERDPTGAWQLPDAYLIALADLLSKTDAEEDWQLAQALVRTLPRYAQRIPVALENTYRQLLERRPERMQSECIRALLAHESALLPRLQPELLRVLEQSSSWHAAMQAIGSITNDASYRALVAQLEAEDPARRQYAIGELVVGWPERGEALLPGLLDDPSPQVRRMAAHHAGRLFSKEAVPGLLRLMSDPDKKVRDAAKISLDEIRYYHEQVAHWQKWLEGSGLAAKSPAEALVEQAQKGKTAEIRLLAIRSLGKLGEATTLPFLIALLESEDEAVVQAARHAIEEIHAKAK